MTAALLAQTAGLGLAAVDVVGIALMPILLAQRRGAWRASVFLLGSFVALVGMGLLFTTGLGTAVVHLTASMPWLAPGIEVAGGLVVLVVGVVLLARARHRREVAAPRSLVARMALPGPLLFAFGAALVAVQSVVDVVFVVAMVEIGERDLPLLQVLALVLAYAAAALVLQAVVVVAYLLTPAARREPTMARFADWLSRRGDLWAGVVAVALGVVLVLAVAPELVAALRPGERG